MCFKGNSHVLLFQMHGVMLKLIAIDISKYLKLFFIVYLKLNFSKASQKETLLKYCFSDKTDFLSLL